MVARCRLAVGGVVLRSRHPGEWLQPPLESAAANGRALNTHTVHGRVEAARRQRYDYSYRSASAGLVLAIHAAIDPTVTIAMPSVSAALATNTQGSRSMRYANPVSQLRIKMN